MASAELHELRKEFHDYICHDALLVDEHSLATNADCTNTASTEVALALAKKVGASQSNHVAGQRATNRFAQICTIFIKKALRRLLGSRSSKWTVAQMSGSDLRNAEFDQYPRLKRFGNLLQEHPQLRVLIGSDDFIKPDILVFYSSGNKTRHRCEAPFAGESCDLFSPTTTKIRKSLQLTASISCKWTIRSDRSQNSRSEALNLVRNRKGHTPHIVVVTAEPLPSRLASIALGTGDIDCVYHFALTELRETVNNLKYPDAQDLLKTLIEGKRLRDISDLPLDLSV